MKDYRITYKDKEEMYSTIYSFLQNPDLNNPEVTLLTSTRGKVCPLTYTRNGGFGNGKIPKKKELERMVRSGSVQGIMLVAGTNKDDTRRMSAFYADAAEGESALVVKFPTAKGRLTKKEEELLAALQGNG